jgi:hypothetical protein
MEVPISVAPPEVAKASRLVLGNIFYKKLAIVEEFINFLNNIIIQVASKKSSLLLKNILQNMQSL